MTRAKDISKIVTDADLSGTLDVTGTVTAGGLTLAPSQVINLNSGADSFDDIFRNESENATIINARNNVRINLDSNSDSTNAEFVIGYNGTNTTTAKALSVGESGDISFYEDTGTTPKLFWDASAEILGIGTSSPADVRLTLFSGGSGTAGQLKLGFDSNDFFQIGRNDIAGAGGGNFQIKPNGGTSIFDITSGGNVGIGTSSPDEKLDVRGSLQVGVDGTTAGLIRLMDSGSVTEEATISTDANGGLIFGGNSGAGELIFRTGSSTERMRIDSSGNVGIGTDSPNTKMTVSTGVNSSTRTFLVDNAHSGGSMYNAFGVYVGATDRLVTLSADYGDSIMAFQTNSTERMRIESGGNIVLGKTTVNTSVAGVYFSTTGSGFTRESGSVAFFNRQNNDGQVIGIGQQDITEGTISVSGSTVSYNGGHLSRWSRLLDNSKDTTIVKGTVMTNLDEMVEWGDEDNEQLNKMAVSSVEGDANVAGVFVNWDEDDDYNDMNIAMTGDMVIRIAQGTTVARGDLLMSAGDGTAKPQGDDIVRSKTIAKVTSTNVSHTYDDGTYLVPCVLMAC